jgi:hypothetical protein
MAASKRNNAFASAYVSPLAAFAIAMLVSTSSMAQENGRGGLKPLPKTPAWPTYVVAGEPEISTLYYDGSQTVVRAAEVWTLTWRSNPVGVTVEDLRRWAKAHHAAMGAGPVTVIDTANPSRTTHINIVYHADGSVPPAAIAALGMAEAYLECLFADPISVDIGVSFQNLGDPGVIGATLVNYIYNVSYTISRNGLINGMDCDDVIQGWLPIMNYCPVRFDGGSDTITNQMYVNWAKANYKATIGTAAGYDGYTTFNTQVTFDYDPTNGIPPGQVSFVDVALHETAHVLGFDSAVDLGQQTMDAMDLYRFQRTDGGYDYNPDTYEEFQVRPRLVSFNSPDDDHICDLIMNEYRMSDGDPWPGSHFRDQYPRIGLMGPYIPDGVTYYPNYYTSADIDMLDAMGYDYPACCVWCISPPLACIGSTVQLHADACPDLPNPTYQWWLGAEPLPETEHYAGTLTDTLTIVNVTLADGSDMYNCVVSDPGSGCVYISDYCALWVDAPITITSQPADQTVPRGADVVFSVVATGTPPFSYQWRRFGLPLQDGDNIFGATTPNLMIMGVMSTQAGEYDCVVSNVCGTVTSAAALLCVDTGYGAGRGDLNCDGTVDFGDINPFICALGGCFTPYWVLFPDCDVYNGDINCNGAVGFDDINPFVALLCGG